MKNIKEIIKDYQSLVIAAQVKIDYLYGANVSNKITAISFNDNDVIFSWSGYDQMEYESFPLEYLTLSNTEIDNLKNKNE